MVESWHSAILPVCPGSWECDRGHILDQFRVTSPYSRAVTTGSGSFYEQSCRCLGDQLDAARALASQIADRSDIRYGMACVTTFGDFAEHAPHEL